MNKKGDVRAIIIMFVVLFVLLLGSVALVFGGVVIDWAADEIVPEISSLGSVGDANLTEAAEYSVIPVNNVIQSFHWISGVLYVMGILGCVGLAFAASVHS